MDENKSKISNVEWGFVIGALFTIDIVQIMLEWMLIGFFLNPFIDILVGMSLGLYLQIRGESLANPKRLLALLATFSFELVPIVSELPLWGLDGIFNMVISKKEKIISKIPGSKMLTPDKGVKESEQRPRDEITDNENNR